MMVVQVLYRKYPVEIPRFGLSKASRAGVVRHYGRTFKTRGQLTSKRVGELLRREALR